MAPLAGQHSQVGCSKSETLQNLDVHGRTLIKNNVAYITTRTADMDFTWVDRNTTIVLNCVPAAAPDGPDEIKLPQATSHNVGMEIKFIIAHPTIHPFKVGVDNASNTIFIGGLVLVGAASEGAALGAWQAALVGAPMKAIDLDGDEAANCGDAGTYINFTYVAAERIAVDGVVTAKVDNPTGANVFGAIGIDA